MSEHRRGFVLITVLWALAFAAVMAMGVELLGRQSYAAARNRVEARDALWRAHGQLELARRSIDEVLGSVSGADGLTDAWRVLDVRIRAEMPLEARCGVTVTPVGARIDINAADADELSRALAGAYGDQAPAAAAAILDWRDPDDTPTTEGGAEVSWYAANHRPGPRNGPFASIGELTRVRYMESARAMDSVFTTVPSRVAINHAPGAVLGAIAGFTPELVERILERRARGLAVTDLLLVAADLSPAATDSFKAHYPEIAHRTELDTGEWIVQATCEQGGSRAVIEAGLVRSGARAMVVLQKVWT